MDAYRNPRWNYHARHVVLHLATFNYGDEDDSFIEDEMYTRLVRGPTGQRIRYYRIEIHDATPEATRVWWEENQIPTAELEGMAVWRGVHRGPALPPSPEPEYSIVGEPLFPVDFPGHQLSTGLRGLDDPILPEIPDETIPEIPGEPLLQGVADALSRLSVSPPPDGQSFCIICQDDHAGDVYKFPCGHTCPEDCTPRWFHAKATCPACRHDVREPLGGATPEQPEEQQPVSSPSSPS